MDQATQSNYRQVSSKHVDFDWTIDFEKRIVSGSATHDLVIKEDNVEKAVLDTYDLDISSVTIGSETIKYELKEKHAVMGSALHIPLPSGLKSGDKLKVSVAYSTTKDSIALQWLDKEQTQGKAFPYLFSQCQPIYARALSPLQDTASNKITYSAKISSVLPVLFSAIRQSPPSEGPAHDGKTVGKDLVTYTYDQPVAVPTYLLAILSGNVVYRPFPPYEDRKWKTGVWAEPEIIEAAYWEFHVDTPKFLAADEDLVHPYHFGVYDIAVLPPAFPYGGMENACLTFLTPTLLTGDRMLVDVVAHEISHSYFGNGVTQAHATHFWLNEGWTTYMERLLLQVVRSPAERDFSYIIGYKGLVDALELYKDTPKYQRLVIEFEYGEDPDEAYSRIPYDKGANLILHIERTLGGLDVFLPYVKEYVKTFLGKSITTPEWKDHLYAYFKEHGGDEKVKALDSIDWNAWFYGEGTKLPVDLQYDTTLAEPAYALAAKWDQSRSSTDFAFTEKDLEGFNSNQIVAFLETLVAKYKPLPAGHLTKLAELYKLSTTHNAEVRLRFYQLVLADPSSEGAKKYAPEAANWVTGGGSGVVVGRMKFCRDVLRDVYKVDKDLAVKAYTGSRNAFHPITQKLIDKDLGVSTVR